MNLPTTLDDVLFAFHQAVDVPGPDDVARWTKDYPEFADEIRAHAVEIIDMEALAADEPSTGETAVAAPAQTIVGRTLREVARAGGISLADFADEIDISPAVVSDVNTGRILPGTVTKKFVRLTAGFFRLAIDEVAAVVAGPKERPAFAMLKARSGHVEGKPVTWEEAVLASDMDEERKAFWLSPED
ncbi:helix-turn-helix domain-containing protein [Methylorubrum thiocyanatum]|uniref:helix-turn-helix domain-containing protein n=1 Tax=Methylorubrum thiocyanatum TaxID=47958 RepID=UPI00398C44EE